METVYERDSISGRTLEGMAMGMQDSVIRKQYGNMAFGQLIFSLAVLAFGAIYEHFSFGVYSVWMIYAFAFPLLLGVLPFTVMTRLDRMPELQQQGITLWSFGIITLTVGSIVTGVLEIYGTTNALTGFYKLAGALLLAAGAVMAVVTGNRDAE